MGETDLRSFLLDQKAAGAKLVTIGGQSIELKPPTLALRNKLLRNAGFFKGNDGADVGKLRATAIIELAQNPTTHAPIFTRADLEALQGADVGTAIDTLGEEAQKMLQVKGLTLDEQLKALAEGKSEEVAEVLEEARKKIAELGASNVAPEGSAGNS